MFRITRNIALSGTKEALGRDAGELLGLSHQRVQQLVRR